MTQARGLGQGSSLPMGNPSQEPPTAAPSLATSQYGSGHRHQVQKIGFPSCNTEMPLFVPPKGEIMNGRTSQALLLGLAGWFSPAEGTSDPTDIILSALDRLPARKSKGLNSAWL